ncbi:MAG: cysteine hydrolase family protein [Caldisericaceae bacterium]
MNKRRVCLLIIDMQYDFLEPDSELFVKQGPAIIGKISELLSFFREHQLSIVFVRRLHRKDGSDIDKPRADLFSKTGGFLIEGSRGAQIVEKLKPLDNEIVITKKRWSAFFGTELDLILRRSNINTLIMCGVQTPNCIRATFTDAISFDYDVVVMEDGTASNNEETQRANLNDMKNMGARIMSVKEIVELLNNELPSKIKSANKNR